jgi:hypothetical protein
MAVNTAIATSINFDLSQVESDGPDVRIENLVLTTSGHGIPAVDLATKITAGRVEQTMQGAPMLSLTIPDTDYALLESGLFNYKVDAVLDGVPFRLVSVGLQDDRMLTLSLEHRVVSYLREHKSPLKVSRNVMTRGEFIYKLVREVHAVPIRLVAPSMDIRQRIAKPKVEVTHTTRSGTAGISDTVKLTVAGAPASKAQRRQMERVLAVAAKLHAGDRAVLALVVAAIGESGFTPKRNQGNPPSRYWGVFQGSMDVFAIDDTEGMATAFLKGGQGFQRGGAKALARAHPEYSPGQIAYMVEGDRSNFTSDALAANFYDKWRSEAEKIIAAYTGGGDAAASFGGGGKYWKRYEFTRGVPGVTHEDSWGAIQRLAAEVRWRAFVVGTRSLYYVTDDDLLKGLPRYIITPDTDGLVSLNFDVEVGGRFVIHRGIAEAKPAEATLRVRVDRWEAQPGSSVLLDGWGPGGGTWLVDSVTRDLFDAEAEVNLRKPQLELPEPTAQIGTHPYHPSPATGRNRKPVGSQSNGGGGSYGNSDGSYTNPFKGATVGQSRIDEGVDYVVSGPIRAVGAARIVFLGSYSGFGTYLVYELIDGEQKGKRIYVAEGLRPVVARLDKVSKGQKIAVGVGAIESGWAQGGPTFLPYAQIAGGYHPDGVRTAAGMDFDKFMQSLGVIAGRPDSGAPGKLPVLGHYP